MRRLIRTLPAHDLIHAANAFFLSQKTAERLSHRRCVSLTASFLTDKPAYATIFTRQTIEAVFRGSPCMRRRRDSSCRTSSGGFMRARISSRLLSEIEIGGMAVAEAIAAGAPMLPASKASSARTAALIEMASQEVEAVGWSARSLWRDLGEGHAKIKRRSPSRKPDLGPGVRRRQSGS